MIVIPQEIELDGRRCWDIGWGIVRENWPAEKKKSGGASLFVKPLVAEAQSWSVVYISTETGKCQGIYYVMRSDDARRFVMDSRTHGVGQRGTHWQYFQTSIFNFLQKGGIQQCRFTHDTGKMDPVLKDLEITPLTKTEIEDLFGHLGYAHSKDIRGLCPGVVYEIDGKPVDIDTDHPRDITGVLIELDRAGHSYRSAMWEGWANLDSNLGLDVIWSRPVTIMYDRKYR